MTLNGIKDLFKFTEYLRAKGIRYYTFDEHAFGTLTIHFTLVGARVEVYIEEDAWGYSIFKGREEVLDDFARLDDLFAKHWGE